MYITVVVVVVDLDVFIIVALAVYNVIKAARELAIN